MAKQVRERPRRPYSSAIRKAQADATRLAIVRAAKKVFTESGYASVTVEAVASAAGVSVPTVYAVFGSKAALLSAVVADAGGDRDIRAMAERALGQLEPRARLFAAARVVRTIMQRERPVLELVEQAGTGSPDLVAALRQVHAQQREALGRVLRPMHELGALRPDLDLSDAIATFSSLASPECYRLLVVELGWSGARWERWLGESAARLLL
ncbi:MAG TPA: helix-turn-helix domain-containing protein [Candidatus Dormibacteraeota bacterium]|nr:helix-turn-helix domain-containing protein [Candidatus Dormibacteraeota bacterium]